MYVGEWCKWGGGSMRVCIMQSKYVVCDVDEDEDFDSYDFEKFDWNDELGVYIVTSAETGLEIYAQ